MNNDSKENIEKHNKNLESLSKAMETFTKNAPKDGYLKAIKKKHFKPKPNWSMLSVIIGLAALLTTAIIYLS